MSDEQTHLTVPVNETDYVLGPPDAPITLVEYADFECPASRRASFVVHQLHLRLGDDLRIVFRHYPLTHKHSHAQAAAEAAEAAGAQGRFWEMHDLLFTRRDALELWDPESLAEELKIDPVRFSANLRGHVFLDRVRQSARDARESGVSQTPTFFINGELYEGEHDFDSMLHVLNALRPVPGREFTV